MTPHPERLCADCHRPFSPKYSYARWCWPCWRERKRLAENQAKNLENAFEKLVCDFGEARHEIWKLKREVQQLTAANLSLSLRLLEAQARKNPTETTPGLREQLPRLIQLCHPDRHQGSQASVTATQWLLELRKQLS